MLQVHLDTGPPPRSYPTFEEALIGAQRHPRQKRAAASTKLLEYARVTGGSWSTAACGITFSNGRRLDVEARNFQLDWRVRMSARSRTASICDPVELVWSSELTGVFDPRALLARITGAEFTRLFVNEMGLLLYTRENPILWFHAGRIRGSSDDFLSASLEE